MKSVIKLPHIPLRREGEQRAAKSLDDIIAILTCLDGSLNLKCLPKYVAESPDDMPSMRASDGDLATLMVTFSRLKDCMSDKGDHLANKVVYNTTQRWKSTRPVQYYSRDAQGSRTRWC